MIVKAGRSPPLSVHFSSISCLGFGEHSPGCFKQSDSTQDLKIELLLSLKHDIELPLDLQELPLPHEDHLPGGPALLGHLQLGGDHQDEEERSLGRRWLPSQPVTLPSDAGLTNQTTNRPFLTHADSYVT